MHHTASVILELLEDAFPKKDRQGRNVFDKLERLIQDLGIEAAELEAENKILSRVIPIDLSDAA